MAKLDIGDAILTFYGNTNDLDIALAGIPGKTKAATDQASVSIDNFAQSMVNTGQAGTSLADAIKLIPAPVQQTDTAVQNMAFSLRNIAPATDEATEATGRSMNAYQQARGEVMLLSQATGIHLPRSIATMVAGMPGIQGVLQGAFAATAVLFLIDAVIKGIQKFQEWRDEARQLALAWEVFNTSILTTLNGLDDKLLQAGIRMDELRGDHVGALRKELELINRQSMEELVATFSKLAQSTDAMFAKMKSSWLGIITDSTGAKDALEAFKAQYDLLLAQGDKKGAADLLAGTLKSAKDMQQAMIGAKQATGSWAEAFSNGATGIGLKLFEMTRLTDKQSDSQKALVQTLEAQEAVQKRNNALADDNKQIKNTQAYNQQIQETEKLLKAQASERQKQDAEDDKLREQRRNELIANLQQDEREKIDATKAGSQARLAVIDAAIKEEESKGLQETGFYKSLVDERIRLVQSMADAELKIVSESQQRQLKQAAEDAKLELGQIQQNYHAREDAVKQLASMSIISEQQKNQRLIILYNEEEQKSLSILRDQLSKQQAIVEAAQKRETAAQGNPLFSDTQVAELKKNLATAQEAVRSTQTEITKTEDTFEKERLANEKGTVGQAIALAIAAGKQQLALDLQQHQAMLLAIQDEIALARARGLDTNALKAQEKEQQKSLQALVQQSHQTGLARQAWDIFSAEFQKEANTNASAAQMMADSIKTAVDGMESGIQDAFSAMIDGSQSAGQAIEKAMFKTIGSIAQQWALFFIGKGIGDVWNNPGAAAAEFAAGAALEALAGAMGGLGNAGSKSSSAGSGPPAITQNASTSAGGTSTGVVNVPRLADGGLVMSPTLAMVGDAPGGEAIIPLHDAAALSRLATAIAAKMPQQAGGGGGPLQIHLQSDIPLTVRKISQKVNKGQARLLSSNSIRVTRRSV